MLGWSPARAESRTLVLRQGEGRPSPAEAAALDAARAEGAQGSADVQALLAGSTAAAPLPDDFLQRADAAYRLWIRGEFESAESQLARLIDLTYASAADLMRNATVRDQLYRLLVAMTGCQLRLGKQSGARTTLLRLARTFPERPLTPTEHGALAFEEYQRVKQTPLGTLRVVVGGPDVQVYVEGRFVGKGDQSLQVPTGPVVVFTSVGEQFGRVHRVVVEAHTELRVAPQLELMLVSEGPDVNVVPAAPPIQVLLRAKQRLAFDSLILINGASIVVVRDDKHVTHDKLPASPGAAADKLRRLLRASAATSTKRFGNWKLLPIASGVILVGAAAVLPTSFAGHGECLNDRPGCPEQRDNIPPAIGLAAGGALLVGLGAWMWYADAQPSAPIAVSPTERGFAVSWQGRF